MIDWGYVAGFFDGEGTIAPRSGHVAMYQKTTESLDRIATFLRLHGIHCTVSTRKTPRKTNFLIIGQESSLQICAGPGHRTFLRKILPYLCVKKVAVQDYLRYKTMFPPMTMSQIGILGREASSSKYGRGARWHGERDSAGRYLPRKRLT